MAPYDPAHAACTAAQFPHGTPTLRLKVVHLRYAGTCVVCGRRMAVGSRALWDKQADAVLCILCAGAIPELEEPKAAKPERNGANRPNGVADVATFVLHERKIPGTEANVDHIAVGPRGVFVIDTKFHRGRVEERNNGDLFAPEWRLYVGGRDCSRLVVRVAKQVAAVDAAAGDLLTVAGASITPVLCFVEAEWPRYASGFYIAGVEVVGPRKMSKLVSQAGPLAPKQVHALANRLAERLPAA